MPISTINQNGLNAPLTLTSPTLSGTTIATTVTSPAATALTLQSAGTTAVTIDTSQNVGIGTASPGAKIDVRSANNTGTDPIIRAVSQNGNASTWLTFNGVSVSSGNACVFYNGTTEQMRLASGGQLRIGMANYNAQPNGTNSGLELANTNNACVSFAGAPTTSTHWVFGSTNGILGTIQTSGATCSYNNLSDYRQKENVTPMTGALNKVQALKPVTFTWKVDGSDGQGFIAHELQSVIPDAVTGEKDAVDENGDPKYQMVDTSFLVATLTAAIQELKAEFDAYKASHP